MILHIHIANWAKTPNRIRIKYYKKQPNKSYRYEKEESETERGTETEKRY
jgi:hypothetical protein